MASEWYYSNGDSKKGPISSKELKSLASSGEVSGETLVWKEGLATWIRASKVRGLIKELPEITFAEWNPQTDSTAEEASHTLPAKVQAFSQQPDSTRQPLITADNKSRFRIAIGSLLILLILSLGLGLFLAHLPQQSKLQLGSKAISKPDARITPPPMPQFAQLQKMNSLGDSTSDSATNDAPSAAGTSVDSSTQGNGDARTAQVTSMPANASLAAHVPVNFAYQPYLFLSSLVQPTPKQLSETQKELLKLGLGGRFGFHSAIPNLPTDKMSRRIDSLDWIRVLYRENDDESNALYWVDLQAMPWDSDEWVLSVLKALPNFEFSFGLNLSGRANDRVLQALQRFRNLTALNLSSSPVTDSGMKSLVALQKLAVLNLTRTKVTDVGVECLTPLKNLSVVNFEFLDLQGPDLSSLSGLPLSNVSLSHVNCNRDRFKNASVLQGATSLHFGSIKCSGFRLLNEICQRGRLEDLDLSGNPLAPADFQTIRRTKSLRHLDLSKVGNRPKDFLKSLGEKPTLEGLVLSDCKLNADDISAISRISTLKFLDLSRNGKWDGMKPSQLSVLNRLENLEYLDLSWTACTDETVKELATLPNIKAFVLNEVELSDSTLISLGTMKSLESLEICWPDHKRTDWHKFSDKGLRHLSGLHRLKHLRITSAGLDDNCVKELCRIKSLELLDLESNPITFDGLTDIPKLDKIMALNVAEAKDLKGASRILGKCSQLRRLGINEGGPMQSDSGLLYGSLPMCLINGGNSISYRQRLQRR